MLQQGTRADRRVASGPREVDQVARGTHAFMRYSRAAEMRGAVARYIAAGLDHGERCIYVLGDRSLIEVVDALDSGGVDVPQHAADGSLQIIRAQQVYTPAGSFDAQRTVGSFRRALRRALDEGYAGLRAAAEMSWALGGVATARQLEDYEREIDRIFIDGRYTGLCMYDAQRFGPAALQGIERAHASVLRTEGSSPPAA